jgi:5-methylcytosine-specific restriction endonuclease McrA
VYNRRKNVKRRGAKVYDSTLTLFELGERDGWRCHLCLIAVDVTLRFPDLMSATFDHLDPISNGGDDAPENVALAHWICNTRRGARSIDDARLLLAAR